MRSISILSTDGSNTIADGEVMFVRSQSQLALDNPIANGQRLTRSQAERAFGIELVERVLDDGVVSLVPSYQEPARTLRLRRERLGLELDQVAKFAHLTSQLVSEAEMPGKVIPIQVLNEICQVLALDESVLGFKSSSGGDEALGVRLRMLTENRDTGAFSASTVGKLVEAAWVIAKQTSLSEALGRQTHFLVAAAHLHDTNYSFPTYEKGYLLAEKTRTFLGIDDISPIPSIRVLIEETLNIPLIQTELDIRFAGATIANGPYRGIVVNERGRNSDVAVRRMTTCHELAHLLWDSDERLNRLLVDDYDGIERGTNATDVVEMRANSFAVAFLAPREGVRMIVEASSSIKSAIEEISSRYGISISAARHHIHNICKCDTQSVSADNPDFDLWLAAENRTVDFLPGLDDNVPISRRGMFTGIVAKAYLEKRISEDTVAMCLKSQKKLTPEAARSIVELWGLFELS